VPYSQLLKYITPHRRTLLAVVALLLARRTLLAVVALLLAGTAVTLVNPLIARKRRHPKKAKTPMKYQKDHRCPEPA